jgi:integrase
VLPEQIANDLRRWRGLRTMDSDFVFPGQQGRVHLSREAVEKALRETMTLAGKHSPHGWRSAFSTLAREETDFDGELIDLALDHVQQQRPRSPTTEVFAF